MTSPADAAEREATGGVPVALVGYPDRRDVPESAGPSAPGPAETRNAADPPVAGTKFGLLRRRRLHRQQSCWTSCRREHCTASASTRSTSGSARGWRIGRTAVRPTVSVYNLLNANPMLQYNNRYTAAWPAPPRSSRRDSWTLACKWISEVRGRRSVAKAAPFRAEASSGQLSKDRHRRSIRDLARHC